MCYISVIDEFKTVVGIVRRIQSSYPDKITLLRGNHECREITRVYGFYNEVTQKYDSSEPWVWCTEVFDYLGLAAVLEYSKDHFQLVDNRILCIHGGLSPEIATIDQIRTLNRLQEVPPTGCFSDLLWSDPDNVDGFQESPRGAGYLFGENPVNIVSNREFAEMQFNEVNGLELICRAHQMVQQGFQYMFSKNNLITVMDVWIVLITRFGQLRIIVIDVIMLHPSYSWMNH